MWRMLHRILRNTWSGSTGLSNQRNQMALEFWLEKQLTSKLWITFFPQNIEFCKKADFWLPVSSTDISNQRNLMAAEFWLEKQLTYLFHKMWRMLHRISRNSGSNDRVPLILAMELLEYTLSIGLSFLHTVYLKIKLINKTILNWRIF